MNFRIISFLVVILFFSIISYIILNNQIIINKGDECISLKLEHGFNKDTCDCINETIKMMKDSIIFDNSILNDRISVYNYRCANQFFCDIGCMINYENELTLRGE